MSSVNTTLCVVNFSGKEIETTTVSDVLGHDWDYDPPARPQRYRPDLNFTGALVRDDARSEREEINAAATDGAWFTLTFTFTDKSTAMIRINQRDALSKMAGLYTNVVMSPLNSDLEVYQATGECRVEGGVDVKAGKLQNNAFYVRPSTPPDNSSWMRNLMVKNPLVKVNEITMPGSHDAGMYVDNNKHASIGVAKQGGVEWALTQHRSILDQLEAGARYFDLRVWSDKSQIVWTYHGGVHGAIFYGAFGGKLEDILADIKTFLTSSGGSDEVVFLKFTPTDYSSSVTTQTIRDTIQLVTSKLGDLLYTSTTSTDLVTRPLAELKSTGKKNGKQQGTVLATFVPAFGSLRPSQGFFPYNDYGSSPQGLPVYDQFSETNVFSKMAEDQHAKLMRHGGYGSQYLFLYSWTLTGSTSNILDIDLLSMYANPELPKALRDIVENDYPRPNIVYIDNVEPYLCGAIVRSMNTGASHPYAPIRRFHAEKPYRYYYSSGMTGPGWESDGIVFYSAAIGAPGASAVYQYHAANRDPDRYYYSFGTPGPGWVSDGIAFFAYATQVPNTVPIYQFHAKGNVAGIYFYTADRNSVDPNWVSDGIVFYVYDYG